MSSNFVHSSEQGLGKFNLKSTAGATATGAAIGSIIPGPGTVIGAGVGALVSTIPQLFGSHHHKLNTTAFKNASNSKVTIYADAEFNGASKSFGLGWYWLGKHGALSRDTISSVKIPPGMKLDVWFGVPPQSPHGTPSDHGGKHATWTKSKRYVGDAWNDHIDTIRVRTVRQTAAGGSGQAAVAGGKSSGQQPAPNVKTSSLFSKNWMLPVAIGGGVLGIGGLLMAKSKN